MKSRSARAHLARAQPKAAPLGGEHRRYRIRHEVTGLGLLALGLIVALSTFPNAGFFARNLRDILRYLVGDLGALAVAIALLVTGTALVAQRDRIPMRATAISLSVLFAVVLGLYQLTAPGEGVLGREMTAEPGGLVGVLLAEALRPTLGPVLGAIVLVLAGIAALGVLVDTPLATLASVSGRGIVAAATAAVAGMRSLRERRRRPQQPTPRPEPALPRALKRLPSEEARAIAPPRPRPQPTPAAQSRPAAAPPKAISPPAQQLTLADQGLPEPAASSPYKLPPTSLLTQVESRPARDDTSDNIELVESTLRSFGIDAKVVEIERGPRVTRYEIQPPPGVRVSRITNLADDLALGLAALDVRVEAPVPGKGVIGIEVPNTEVVFVNLKEILESPEMKEHPSPLAFALGKDISGHCRVADLQRMPHLLIAGATNTGKSVCLNSMIVSLLFRVTPDEVKFLMVDPKRVELSLFAGIPHLVAPVAHDAKQAAGLLRWAIREMEARYQRFSDLGVRNIASHNELAAVEEGLQPMYYLVIVIDELADLMMQAATEFESSICRIAQLARATGIHLVVATQRPSVNVITGTIKANISSRIAFAVASQVDSRTILDINGAERLVGSGDMLFYPMDATKPMRIQGAYLSERDIGVLVQYLKQQGKPQFLAEAIVSPSESGAGAGIDDEMFDKALDFVLSTKYASASMLQRKLRIGYTRAARLVDMMEDRGYVGPADGSRPREVYTVPLSRGGVAVKDGDDDPAAEAGPDEAAQDSPRADGEEETLDAD
ncbi:MAG TPA: DNA translocase FtsK 4TM domain-containing protein [Armatimonadota bacterium]|nr:DNA translocase FtsK 4TM domain-containing protein [Armatimonadota bacterium]